MKYFTTILILSLFGLNWIIYVQAQNNKQLIYDLNVSQTAFKILKSHIVYNKEAK